MSLNSGIRSGRQFDIAILGATGFTGKLICKYLATRYGGQVKWAMAGRSKYKLDKLKTEIAHIAPAVQNVPTSIVDVGDAQSIKQLASSCKVLVSTVGPYYKYGDAAVDACIQEGTHYCDITGEVAWVRQNILTKHDIATLKGVKIVHMCGNDSIPAETSVWLAGRELNEVHKQRMGQTRTVIVNAKGSASGGTLATVVNTITSVPSKLKKEAAEPYALNPPGSDVGSDKGEQKLPALCTELSKHTMIWPLAAPDARAVRRSSALLGNLYGPNFSFDESRATRGPFEAWSHTIKLFAFFACLLVPPLRWVVMFFIPKPGDGPSQQVMDSGLLSTMTIAYGDPPAGAQPAEVRVKFDLKGADLGYKGTAMMVTEAAICLLEGACKQYGDAPVLQGGILTPAAAFGGALVDRLNNVQNFQLEVVKSQKH